MKRAAPIISLVLIVIALVWLAPNGGHGQDRTDERLASLETRVSILETTVPSAASPVTSLAMAPTATPESFTIVGTVTVTGDADTLLTVGDNCFGVHGFDDITDEAPVTVKDGSGDIIALDRLTD